MTLHTIRSIGFAACLSLTATIASASPIGVTFGANSALFDVDLTTGATSNLRNTGLSGIDGIAFRTANSALYALTNAGDLYELNVTTGAPTLIGATGFTFIEADLAYDSAADVLYGIQQFSAGVEGLVRIDPNTGAGTLVGAMTPAGADYSAGAFDNSGILRVIDTGASGNSVLLSFNKNTAASLASVTMNVNLGATAGLAFDPVSGQGYVVDGTGGTNHLYALNTTTGVLTDRGALGLTDASGLAFTQDASAVPEPATLSLLSLGLLAGVRRFRAGKQ